MTNFSFSYKKGPDISDDIITAWLFQNKCDGILEGKDENTVYFKAGSLLNAEEFVTAFLKTFHVVELYENLKEIETQDWNEKWKTFYRPVLVGDFEILAPWHEKTSDKIPVYISPKMAFGTGTHESTQLVLDAISNIDIEGKRILDIGCGSGILSIAAEKKRAILITGIDIDELAIENAKENSVLNDSDKCQFYISDVRSLNSQKYDIVFANIIAPVLINLVNDIAAIMQPDNILILSGLLESDLSEIENKYKRCGFKKLSVHNQGEWFSMRMIRV